MAGRPEKNSARLRQALSTVYASDTRSGSREFQASSAARAFCGRRFAREWRKRRASLRGGVHQHQKFLVNVTPMVRGRLVTVYGCRPHSGTGRSGRSVPRLEGRALRVARDLGALVEGVLDEQLQAPALVVDARREVDDAVRGLLAQQLALGGAQVGPGARPGTPRPPGRARSGRPSGIRSGRPRCP